MCRLRGQAALGKTPRFIFLSCIFSLERIFLPNTIRNLADFGRNAFSFCLGNSLSGKVLIGVPR